jgi:hypothetical protein
MTLSGALERAWGWIHEPVPVIRLEFLRVATSLAILGFMSGRLRHADEWIGDHGFHGPDLGGGDWRQPLYVPPLPSSLAWALAAVMVASGLAFAMGWRTRPSGFVFAATLAFVAVADRLAAFTVSKMAPVVVLAIALGPSGGRLGLDAWRKRRAGGKRGKKLLPASSLRFLQLLPVVIYSASGIAKARGDWLKTPLVLWTHVHDTYQTAVTFALASHLPAWTWTASQGLVLTFELGAPLWFALARTRRVAFVFGCGMHLMIGLMFGPVVWFALLMMSLLIGGWRRSRDWRTGSNDDRGRLSTASGRRDTLSRATWRCPAPPGPFSPPAPFELTESRDSAWLRMALAMHCPLQPSSQSHPDGEKRVPP